jgi:TPR repeat protein
LSQLILNGAGLPQDPVAARHYAERAAQAGDALGKTMLGACLRDGVGGSVDEYKGFGLLKEAADTGYGPALLQLGVAYERGAGTGADRDRAIALYRAAASVGAPGARDHLKALGVAE